MKRNILCLLLPLLLCASNLCAQRSSFDMRYVKQHLFLQNDSDFNVVDIDLEWPEQLNGADIKLIQTKLAGALECGSGNIDSLVHHLTTPLGRPVTGQLKWIPDDRRFCYITYKVRLKSYLPFNYASFEISSQSEPQKLSAVKAKNTCNVLTFDLQRNQCFTNEQLVRTHLIANGFVSDEFMNRLLASLSDDDFYSLRGCNIDGVWPIGKYVGFHVNCVTADHVLSYETFFGYDEVRSLLTKDARRLFTRTVVPNSHVVQSLPTRWQGDSIYEKADSMPHFKGGLEGMRTYVSRALIPEKVTASGRVVVAAVVDKDGRLHDFHVVSPVAPTPNRYAVSLVRDMPQWVPGMQGGKPVCVRVYIPLNFKK